MKNVLVAVLFLAVLTISGAYDADAQMCAKMGGGMMGGMDCGMMGGMKHGMGGGMMGGRGCGCGMGCGMMGGMQLPMMHHLKDLKLDAKQETIIDNIRNKSMKEMIKKKADMQILMIDLRALIDSDPVDMKAVEAKMKEMEGLRTSMHLSMIKTREEIKAALTPEQKKKLGEMMSMPCGMDDDMCGMTSPSGDDKEDDNPMMQHMEHMKH